MSRVEEGAGFFLLPWAVGGIALIAWFVGAVKFFLEDRSLLQTVAYVAYPVVLGGMLWYFYTSYQLHALGRRPRAARLAWLLVRKASPRLVGWVAVFGCLGVGAAVFKGVGEPWKSALVFGSAALGLVLTFVLYPFAVRVLTGARRVTDPDLLATLYELNALAGTRVTRLYALPSVDQELNAMATGIGRHPTIFMTEPLLESLSLRELRAILAHELAHVRARHLFLGLRDSLGGMLLRFAVLTGAFLGLELLLEKPGPLASVLVIIGANLLVDLAFSLPGRRRHETEADALAASWVGADDLAQALEKLHPGQPSSSSRIESALGTHPTLGARLGNIRRQSPPPGPHSSGQKS